MHALPDTAAVCITGQLRGVCSPHHTWFVIHRVLTAFQKADLFVIVPQESCERAAWLYPNATYFLCANDRPFSPQENHWLANGPNMCWNRESYILQLRSLYRCSESISRHEEKGTKYKWIVRTRADVLWHRFPSFEQIKVLDSTVLHGVWYPILQWQAFADNFAISSASNMHRYFKLYDFVLDPTHWDEYSFNSGDAVWRRVWGHSCNYPEMILEHYLFSQNVPTRYSRDICFMKMRSCGTPLENHCGSRDLPQRESNGAVRNDLVDFLFFDGREVLSEQTFPMHYEHDAVLAGRLVEFFHNEHQRMGRPAKIVDLGCGRGTLVQELLKWGLIVVGIDDNPLITATIPEYAAVEDITNNLSFTIRSLNAACDFQPFFGRGVDGFDFEKADKTSGETPEHIVGNSLVYDPTPWMGWVSYLGTRCCMQLTCKGFTTDGFLKYHIPGREYWTSFANQALYVKRSEGAKPDPEESLVGVHDYAVPGFWERVQDGSRTMDWVISLDVAQEIPTNLLDAFFGNIGNLAREGVIFSWGRKAGERELRMAKAYFEGLGFLPDKLLEADLRLFAGTSCCSHLRGGLHIFRRVALLQSWKQSLPHTVLRRMQHAKQRPRSCRLRPLPSKPQCMEGVDFGCVDDKYIWVRHICGGLFWRGAEPSSKVAPNFKRCRPKVIYGGYEECELPEPSSTSSRRTVEQRAIPINFGLCQSRVFEAMHNGTIANLYNSADPLARPGEGIWSLASCGLVTVTSKLFRWLVSPTVQFLTSHVLSLDSEWRFILTSWDWQRIEHASAWLPEMLLFLARRARWLLPPRAPSCGLLKRAGTSLQRCSWSQWPNSCSRLIARQMQRSWAQCRHGSSSSSWLSLGLLVSGVPMWSALKKRALHLGAKPLPVAFRKSIGLTVVATPVDRSPVAKYFLRLATLPF